jgi:hypothetical protein
MTLELTDTSTQVYYIWPFYYARTESKIILFDNDYYFELPKGTEVFGANARRLKKLTPLPRSEGMDKLNELKSTIENLKNSI